MLLALGKAFGSSLRTWAMQKEGHHVTINENAQAIMTIA
jgi:hypothetical protein